MSPLWSELIPLEVSAGAGRDGWHCLPRFHHVQKPLATSCRAVPLSRQLVQPAKLLQYPSAQFIVLAAHAPPCALDSPKLQQHGKCRFISMKYLHISWIRFQTPMRYTAQHLISTTSSHLSQVDLLVERDAQHRSITSELSHAVVSSWHPSCFPLLLDCQPSSEKEQ